jgi:hypothetical protein
MNERRHASSVGMHLPNRFRQLDSNIGGEKYATPTLQRRDDVDRIREPRHAAIGAGSSDGTSIFGCLHEDVPRDGAEIKNLAPDQQI